MTRRRLESSIHNANAAFVTVRAVRRTVADGTGAYAPLIQVT
jgi:hypothetical protein